MVHEEVHQARPVVAQAATRRHVRPLLGQQLGTPFRVTGWWVRAADRFFFGGRYFPTSFIVLNFVRVYTSKGMRCRSEASPSTLGPCKSQI